VYDYFNGIEDLKKRLVRFFGEPEKRVQEDYLRIMRYFRFFSRIAEPDSKFHEESYNAIKKNSSGLQSN
jgi:tRNA nucleotidyltransferase (CCA-adding enzyme)